VRYHDFHLAGYSVSDFGGTIVLRLVYDYPGQPHDTSRITFADVSAYHFVHTGGAIITDIDEVPLSQLIAEVGPQLAEWWRQHGGYAHWSDEPTVYIETLEQTGHRGWTIGSAIGFEGFVIAKSVQGTEDVDHA
jgi:hypothetical protein